MGDLTIRRAEESDARELLAIYAPYVTDTAITFEYEVPSETEFARRIYHTLQKHPFLAAVRDGQIEGYAYASPFKEREAYDWSVETTVYLRQDCRGRGTGTQLYHALEDFLRRQHILNANACIAYNAQPDARLDHTSVLFHEHMGYRKTAHFTQCGYKFGTWYDMVWMEKMLGEHPDVPPAVIPASLLV